MWTKVFREPLKTRVGQETSGLLKRMEELVWDERAKLKMYKDVF